MYQGEIKIDLITKFLNNYSYKAPSYEKKLELVELTYKNYKSQGLCKKSQSNYCVILFTEKES